MSEDIYDREDHISLDDECFDEYFCYTCGWCDSSPYLIEEYGMVFHLCPVCGANLE